MKKVLIIILLLLISSCSINRDLYYNFQFDDYSISVGHDDLEYIKLIYDCDVVEQLDRKQEIKDIEIYFFDDYLANIDIKNYKNRKIKSNKAIVSKLDVYLTNLDMNEYKIYDQILSTSIKENCEIFEGEYLDNNGYGCVFGKKVKGKYNYVILHGDILNKDQDELVRIEIYVE